MENLKERFKEFGPTSWSIKNKTSIYLTDHFCIVNGYLPVCHITKRAVS